MRATRPAEDAMTPSTIAYRGDVDGLRAVAVAAVVLFHAGGLVPGGFVGVDVFFVISGYLITSLIAAELDAGRFSIARFWERRIRRIWPASLVVTVAVLFAGWCFWLPRDFKSLAHDAIAQIAMLANVRFWYKTDYFAAEADINPLLHMWSLAVEEQFYVVFPLILMLLWPLGRTSCIGAVSLLGMASLLAGVGLIASEPMAVFYLLPFRAWELLLGVFVSLLPRPLPLAGSARELFGMAGVAMIVHCCLTYEREMQFPAAAAIEPCLGTAVLLAAGSGPGTAVSRMLDTGMLRFFGRISYSVYLWHWPLLAVPRYVFGAALPTSWVMAAMTCLVPVAYLSYRWIEVPFRVAATPRARQFVVGGALAGSLAVLAASTVISRSDGFPARFPPEVLAAVEGGSLCRDWETRKFGIRGSPEAPKPIGAERNGTGVCFVLWGDSHGMAISPVVDEVAKAMGVPGTAALMGGTPPLAGRLTALTTDQRDCAAAYEAVLAWVRLHRPRHVVLCARWSLYMPQGLTPADQRAGSAAPPRRSPPTAAEVRLALQSDLQQVIHDCEQTGATVWVLLEVPCQPWTPRERALAAFMSKGSPSMAGIDRAAHDVRAGLFSDVIHGLAAPHVRIMDLATPFFEQGVASVVGRDDRMWYVDDNHLNPSGARAALEMTIRAIMRQIADDCAQPIPKAGGAETDPGA
jgi:peptidoglycan/LPS O-acetylase OafA/YrhL